MESLLATPLKARHEAFGAKMVEFGGWWMPIQYREGIVAEHLATRRGAGLFDVSHMGRFSVSGANALPFLQHALTNDASILPVGRAQYTMIPDDAGGAVDDAYLYRFRKEAYLLVVNAANRAKDWDCLTALAGAFGHVELCDDSAKTAMLALQGPDSEKILVRLVSRGTLPEPRRNAVGEVRLLDFPVAVARTGYTGEPLGFELLVPAEGAVVLWDRLLEEGAAPVGLGARDTLRLEAGLPLYGHELGTGPDGQPIPIFACPLARFAVSLAPAKGDFIGRAALSRQREAQDLLLAGDFSRLTDLPRRLVSLTLEGQGIARAGAPVFHQESAAGWVTSGTMVPYAAPGKPGAHMFRPLALALVDSRLRENDTVEIEVRGKRLSARLVRRHLDSRTPPFSKPLL
ncbi:MAG: glycine cleavage system aminomethyltransferase GcvT [Verrucomicrobiae bacterium]|nr:glycine cleavage system aminomethyltransferase GcvT [Verrucomicrobiae bacterium]